MIRTDHILFIAAGAFHVTKPSDLIPELQGRLPIRVELQSLKEEDFIRILTEPKNALLKQYVALLETEGVKLNFTEDAVAAVARFATSVNEQTENIGARRLHTILEKVLDEISFEAPDLKKKNVKVDAAYVTKQLADIVKNQDLSRLHPVVPEIGKWKIEKGRELTSKRALLCSSPFSIFSFPFSYFLLAAALLANPFRLRRQFRPAIKDLTARQAGDGVQLSFTLPSNSISGQKLAASARR